MPRRCPIDAGYEDGGRETELKDNKVRFIMTHHRYAPIIFFVDITIEYRHR